jgi:hypothetical protein
MSEQAIKDVIRTAYFEGVYLEQDPQKVAEGFHPDFRMITSGEEALGTTSAQELLGHVADVLQKRPELAEAEVTHDVSLVETSGDAGAARVEIYVGGRHIYTDFLLLYASEGRWRIVCKTYQRHAAL